MIIPIIVHGLTTVHECIKKEEFIRFIADSIVYNIMSEDRCIDKTHK